MVFSSAVFLFLFLPLVMILYFSVKGIERKNMVLLVFSIVFYAWGEPIYVFLLIGSIVLNWAFGRLVVPANPKRRAWLFLSVAVNIGILFVFKYLGFALRNINLLLGTHHSVDLALPIGISFFTFQAVSYVIDVYTERGTAQKRIRDVALYISFFPQLIAGPIIRYQTIAEQIHKRETSAMMIREGVRKFILGLGKKVVFANSFSLVADAVFNSDQPHGSIVLWLGAIAYTLQILFDFSGYSDMAIGLGKIFGFSFPENFDYPYISKSLTEFWRRWHISLGTWFRDYVYIPLGGNRVSHIRHIINLLVVWFLTGLWHGANWTFIAWGLGFFLVLVFEKYTHIHDIFENKLHILPHIYTMLIVIISWVVFRSKSLSFAWNYICGMFGPIVKTADEWPAVREYIWEYLGIFILSLFLLIPWRRIGCFREKNHETLLAAAKDIVLLLMFILSISYIIKGNYSPFIYFNF